jgi:transposase
MATIISKKKGNKLYYYVVESARVRGRPRIVHQTYLGSAERVAELLKDRTAPIPVAASRREFGLPGALWIAAQRSGVWDVLKSMGEPPESGPSPAHYLLLAAIHRICQPGPKTEVANWYQKTILSSIWRFPPERFRSQDFWDCFDRLQVATGEESTEEDELEKAQSALLGCWKDRQMVSRRLLAYDTTNFYTWTASTNQRNTLAQRGHNKQGRHNLRQIGLSYVLDADNGISLCHHVYAGNVPDVDELPKALERIVKMLDRNQIERSSVTLVFDKGTAALDNTLLLNEAGVGWISALPWNQAPPQLRERPVEELPLCSSAHPGVHAVAERANIHGAEYLCVLKYSSAFATEQLHSLTTSLAKVMQSMRRLSQDLAKPGCRVKEISIRNKIRRWLAPQFLEDLIQWQLTSESGRWHLQFDFNGAGFQKLITHRLGRTVLVTPRLDWTAEEVVAAYSGQQRIETVFRGFKDGDWLGWGPMYHWTDSKILVHAFYCMVGISLLQYIYKQAQTAWPGLSMEQMLDQLRQIEQFVLLYPPQGEKGPQRAAVVQSKQTFPQQQLARVLGLDELAKSHTR